MDKRYLNFNFAPVVSPLEISLKIELYNDNNFPSNSKHIINHSTNQISCQSDSSALAEHHATSNIPTAADLFKDSNNDLPTVEVMSCESLNTASIDTDLDNKLFFVRYKHIRTLCRRWYLIQMDI